MGGLEVLGADVRSAVAALRFLDLGFFSPLKVRRVGIAVMAWEADVCEDRGKSERQRYCNWVKAGVVSVSLVEQQNTSTANEYSSNSSWKSLSRSNLIEDSGYG